MPDPNSHTINIKETQKGPEGKPIYNVYCLAHPWALRQLTRWQVLSNIARHLKEIEKEI